MNILEFSEKIINGVGGLHDYEYHEMATPNYDRDVSVAIWVIKCLANPKCEGSQDAIQAIIERRERISAEITGRAGNYTEYKSIEWKDTNGEIIEPTHWFPIEPPSSLTQRPPDASPVTVARVCEHGYKMSCPHGCL